MSITCTVTPGHTYGANHTVDYGDLNKLGTPGVSVPDGGTLAFGAGTALLPSISIAGDPDTGFYQPTVDQIAFTAGGVARLVFGADGLTGNVRANAGTSGAPSLAFATDTDTGFYLAGANTIGVAGALGLADGTAAAPSLAFVADADTGLARTAANTMAMSCGGAVVATVSAAGIDAVGLRIAGVAVSTAGLDFSAARYFDDFHAPLATSGWLVYTASGGIVSQCASEDQAFQAQGMVRLYTGGVAEAYASAWWPHNPGGLSYAGNLTNFSTTDEYLEFGFRFAGALGTPGAGTSTAVRLGVGYTTDANYLAPDNPQNFIYIEYAPTSSANFTLRISSSGSVTSSVTPSLNTYYRARITRTATGYTLKINGTVVATVTTGHPFFSSFGRIFMANYGQSTSGAVVDVDYVQWEKPVTRT